MRAFRNSFFCLLALTFGNPSYADDIDDKACKVFADTAEVVMQARQAGVPLDEVLNTFEQESEANTKLSRAIVLEAYDSPKYDTDENQAEAASEFRNKFLVKCLKGG